MMNRAVAYGTGQSVVAAETRQSWIPMTERDFASFRAIIGKACGIRISPSQKTMIEGRLQKRLRQLGMDSFREYADYLRTPPRGAGELVMLIDAVTAHKTDFFREPAQFEYLAGTVLPKLTQFRDRERRCRLRVWSAGCSSGEEPYTLAMVLREYAACRPGVAFSILATDISPAMLEKGRSAVYPEDRIAAIPPLLRNKYLSRNNPREKSLARVAHELRELVEFRRLNLLAADFGDIEPMAVIFCRNVLVYFDRFSQIQALNGLCRHLIPGGYLFVGHSETLNGLELPVAQVAQGVYRKYL